MVYFSPIFAVTLTALLHINNQQQRITHKHGQGIFSSFYAVFFRVALRMCREGEEEEFAHVIILKCKKKFGMH